MRRLICAFVVPIWHKTHFLLAGSCVCGWCPFFRSTKAFTLQNWWWTWSGSTLCAKTCLSENLGSLLYTCNTLANSECSDEPEHPSRLARALYMYMSRRMTKPAKWPVHPAKTQTSLGIRPDWSVFTVCLMVTQTILLVLSCCGSYLELQAKRHIPGLFECLWLWIWRIANHPVCRNVFSCQGSDLEMASLWSEYYNTCLIPNWSDRQVRANSIDTDRTAPEQSDQSTLFAILSSSFGCITV